MHVSFTSFCHHQKTLLNIFIAEIMVVSCNVVCVYAFGRLEEVGRGAVNTTRQEEHSVAPRSSAAAEEANTGGLSSKVVYVLQ